MDLTIDDFITGLFAVLAYHGKPAVHLDPRILNVSLAQTLQILEKQMRREQIAPRFRVPSRADSLPVPLRHALARLEGEAKLRAPADPASPATITWPKEDAYQWLATTPHSIGFFERAAKVFWRQHETARIRVSLHRLATRGKGGASPGSVGAADQGDVEAEEERGPGA